MRTIANILFWLGSVVVMAMVVGMAHTHFVGGSAMRASHIAIDACRARQAILVDVDRNGWTPPQKEAFNNICDIRPFTVTGMDLTPFSIFIAAAFLIGTALYFVVMIRDARKSGRKPSR